MAVGHHPVGEQGAVGVLVVGDGVDARVQFHASDRHDGHRGQERREQVGLQHTGGHEQASHAQPEQALQAAGFELGALGHRRHDGHQLQFGVGRLLLQAAVQEPVGGVARVAQQQPGHPV